MTGPPMSATVVIGFPQGTGGRHCPSAAAGACAPDIEAGPAGTSSQLRLRDGSLVLSVDAQDTASLRAALNAHLRCLSLALDVSARATVGGSDDTDR